MRRIAVAASFFFLLSCDGDDSSTPAFLEGLPELGRASAQQDSTMRAFARDLEAWSVRAGRPASAEALIGPLFLRVSDVHTEPSATDTSVDAGYQRLEVQFARILHARDSLRTAANAARDSLTRFLESNRERTTQRRDSILSPIFPPDPNDSTRFVLRLGNKCPVITVKVLPSKEGVEICVITFKHCVRNPGSGIWSSTCAWSCVTHIGWVPEGGNFEFP